MHDSVSLNDMPPGFTPIAENVRFYEPLTFRGRGGSRPGIDKFIPEQHSGLHEIQHLAEIVTVDGSAVGWAFNGQDQAFPGLYGGIGFLEQIPGGQFGGFPGSGGGGYQPNNAVSRIITMGYRIHYSDGSESIFTPSPDPNVSNTQNKKIEWPAGPDPVYVRVFDQDARQVAEHLPGYQSNEIVEIITDPKGGPGDGTTGGTQFGLDTPPLGMAEFAVSSALPQTVTYIGVHVGFIAPMVRFFSINTLTIRFTPEKLTLDAELG